MRDKIFETSASLSVTDDRAILDAKDAGSSVHISWGTFLLLVVVALAVAATAVTVAKKGGAGGAEKEGLKK